MQALSGQAREEYRDAQYAASCASAPWKQATGCRNAALADVLSSAPAADAKGDAPAKPHRRQATTASDAAARHTAMREKLEASRSALAAICRATTRPACSGGSQAPAPAKPQPRAKPAETKTGSDVAGPQPPAAEAEGTRAPARPAA